MGRRKRILFVSESITLAQIVRLATLAQALDRARYEIHFAATAFPEVVDVPSRRWPLYGMSAARARARVQAGKRLYPGRLLRRYVEADVRLLREVRPDLVVGDLRWSLAVSAPLCRVPLASLINAYWSPHACRDGFPMPDHPVVRWLGEKLASRYFPKALPWVFRYFAAPLNRERERAGLPPIGDLLDVLTYGDFTLYADPPAMVAMRELPAHHHFLGAIGWSAKVPLPAAWGAGAREPVYVTMGSSGPAGCVPTLLRGLARLPVDVLLATAGREVPAGLPANVTAVSFADGEAACARARLVVHNGGASTGYQALAAGRPVLGIPSNLDQCLASERIDARGAGLSIRAGAVTADKVEEAAGRVLGEGEFAMRAGELRGEFGGWDAGERFREFVGGVV